MIAVRIFRKLEAPVAALPELDPLVGKLVQMIAMEEEPEHQEDMTVTAAAAPAVPAEKPVRRQRVRICGVVDRVSDSGDTFRLMIDPTAAAPCTWAGDGASPAVGAAGHRIAVAGTGVFDEAGTLLRVDVKAAAPAEKTDVKFARLPIFGEDEPAEWGMFPMPAITASTGVVPEALAIPLEPPRPALSAATSFTAVFGNAEVA